MHKRVQNMGGSTELKLFPIKGGKIKKISRTKKKEEWKEFFFPPRRSLNTGSRKGQRRELKKLGRGQRVKYPTALSDFIGQDESGELIGQRGDCRGMERKRRYRMQ